MANEKISEMTEVTTLPDGAVIPAVDLTREEGDRNVKITKANLQTDLGAAQDLQSVIDEGGYAQSDDTNSYVDIDLSDAGAGYIDGYINDGTNAAQVYVDKNNASISATEGTETGSVQVGHDQAYIQRVKDGNKTINFNISEPTNTGQVNITTPTLPVGDYSLSINGGEWNASTNTPTLANTDTNVKGVWRKVSVAGSHDFGAGSITFGVGDIVDNDGSVYFKRTDNNQSTGGGSGGDVTKIADVTAMRAVSSAPSDGDLYYLEGHTTAYKGGGMFYWNNTSTATDDNGVVIKPTSIATGRFIRIVENSTISIEDYGAIADGTTESTASWRNAIEYLISQGGGDLIIPNRSQRFVITESQLAVRDYSNITVRGTSEAARGNIFIDSSGAFETTGRGVLINYSSATDNLVVKDLDVLVDEDCIANLFQYGFVCTQDDSWNDVTVKNIKFRNEVKPDSELGVFFFTAFRDNTDPADTGQATNLNVSDNDVFVYGNSVYGIHTNRKVVGLRFENNIVKSQAYTTASQTFNGIAAYGDSEEVCIKGNTVEQWGHSPIAASMARYGVITGNWVRTVDAVNGNTEAGIEVEYKEGHGTSQVGSKSFVVENNHVFDCPIGIWVTQRDTDAISNGADDVIIQSNFIYNSIANGIKISSSNGVDPVSNFPIQNIHLLDNHIEGSGSSSVLLEQCKDITIRGGKMMNSPLGITMGVSTTKYPTGFVKISEVNFENLSDISVRVVNADANITVSNCEFTLIGNIGIRVAAGPGGRYKFLDNNMDGNNSSGTATGVNGISYTGVASVLPYAIVKNNHIENFTSRGVLMGSDNATYRDNYTINCGEVPTYGGTSVTNDNNQNL